jgi:hypothetical protein
MAEEGAGDLSEEQLEVLSERFKAATTFFTGNGACTAAGLRLSHNAIGLSVAPLVGLRAATPQMNVLRHPLGESGFGGRI